MNLLLDTPILLWAISGDAQLSRKAKVESLKFLTHDRPFAQYGDAVLLV